MAFMSRARVAEVRLELPVICRITWDNEREGFSELDFIVSPSKCPTSGDAGLHRRGQGGFGAVRF
jgi:hypothetical protein